MQKYPRPVRQVNLSAHGRHERQRSRGLRNSEASFRAPRYGRRDPAARWRLFERDSLF